MPGMYDRTNMVDPEPVFKGESGKIKYDIIPYIQGEKGLDLGCGPFLVRPGALGIDNISEHFGGVLSNGKLTDASLRLDCDKLSIFGSEQFDYVFSSHLLEHISDWRKTIVDWFRLVRPGGHLIVQLPYPPAYARRQSDEMQNENHVENIYPEDILAAMDGCSWDLVENQIRDKDGPVWYLEEYSFFMVFKKLKKQGKPNVHMYSYLDKEKKIAGRKTCAVVRLGGIGDILVASSVLPWLKEQGYYVRFFTRKECYEVLKENPYIDEFVVDNPPYAVTDDLNEYWHWIEDTHDHTVNLYESFDGAAIARHGTAQHSWWKMETRRNIFGQMNYLEMAHVCGDIPFPVSCTFFESDYEREWAKKKREEMGKDFTIITIPVTGSGVHKALYNMPAAVATLLKKYPNVKFLLTGAPHDQDLESLYPKGDRVIRACGRMSIRKALAFCKQSDVVMGPETGPLNAVGMEPDVHKIIFLSHSNEWNIAGHWTNYTAVSPTDCWCHPCHQLHHSWGSCSKVVDKNNAVLGALCCVNISVEQIVEAVDAYMEKRNGA